MLAAHTHLCCHVRGICQRARRDNQEVARLHILLQLARFRFARVLAAQSPGSVRRPRSTFRSSSPSHAQRRPRHIRTCTQTYLHDSKTSTFHTSSRRSTVPNRILFLPLHSHLRQVRRTRRLLCRRGARRCDGSSRLAGQTSF